MVWRLEKEALQVSCGVSYLQVPCTSDAVSHHLTVHVACVGDVIFSAVRAHQLFFAAP